jgi:Flp pilus assembly pilin Flp
MKYLLIFIIFLGSFLPLLSTAQAPAPPNPPVDYDCFTNPDALGKFESGLFGANKDVCAYVRTPSVINVINLAANIFRGLIVIVAVISIVVAGYMYMTAGGNAEQVSKAKTIVMSALVAILLAFISVIILDTINPELGTSLDEPFQ